MTSSEPDELPSQTQLLGEASRVVVRKGEAPPSTVSAQVPVRTRTKVQKYCSVSFVALYCLVYFTLTSNPKVILYDRAFDNQSIATAQSKSKSNSPVQEPNEQHKDNGRIREQHILHVATKLCREYKAVAPSSWCIDSRLKFDQAKRRPMGLCYLKIPRAASSTLVGINVRIARNFAVRQGLPDSCIRHDGPTPGFYYRQREDGLSFLWTFVRHPSDRAMSRVASNIAKQLLDVNSTMGRLEVVPGNSSGQDSARESEGELSKYVLDTLTQSTDMQFGTISEGRGGFQVQYSMMRVLEAYTSWNATEPTKVQHPRLTQRNVKEILDRYDFIGVVERFDESLVVLQLLLGLETRDILYFSSRTRDQYTIRKGVAGGGTGRGRGNRYTCQAAVNPDVLRTGAVDTYLSSATWWAQNYGDMLLYHAASLSLDQTILQIGLDVFAEALKAFRSMLQLARQRCDPIFPCSQNGTEQNVQAESNCYFDDIGCGYACLDNISESLDTHS